MRLVAVACGLGALLLQPVHAQRPSAPLSTGTAERHSLGEPSYLLMDVSTQRVLASQWVNPDRPVPAGSLVKPFTALAYASAHHFTYPTVTCRGTAGRCWLPGGHGRVGILEAVAESCNAFFHHLAKSIAPDAFASTLRWFGLSVEARVVTPDTMVGLGNTLPLSPPAVARAYVELVSRAGQPGVSPILQGMRTSARSGTGRGLRSGAFVGDALVKTGTSPCVHSPKESADGLALVIYPADRPRVVLLVQAHGRTGAETATLAGHILASAPEAR